MKTEKVRALPAMRRSKVSALSSMTPVSEFFCSSSRSSAYFDERDKRDEYRNESVLRQI